MNNKLNNKCNLCHLIITRYLIGKMEKLSNQKIKKNIYTIEDLGFPSKINSVYPKSKGNIKYFSNLNILKKVYLMKSITNIG